MTGDKDKTWTTVEEKEKEKPSRCKRLAGVMNQLKGNETAGSDEISNELIFFFGKCYLLRRTHYLRKEKWKEERIPMDWNKGQISFIFKQRNPSNCEKILIT